MRTTDEQLSPRHATWQWRIGLSTRAVISGLIYVLISRAGIRASTALSHTVSYTICTKNHAGGAQLAITPCQPKTGVLSELTRRSETDKVRYVYYGLYVQQTCWTERVRNIVAVCAKLQQREAAYHRKMHDFHTHLGSKSAGIDTKCDTGASSTGKAYCHVPIGSHGACHHPGLAIVATTSAHQHPRRGGGRLCPRSRCSHLSCM